MLRFLEDKGLLRHEQEGLAFVYIPTLVASKARRRALKHLVHTFFAGSARDAAAALIEDGRLQGDDLDRLQTLITEARKGER